MKIAAAPGRPFAKCGFAGSVAWGVAALLALQAPQLWAQEPAERMPLAPGSSVAAAPVPAGLAAATPADYRLGPGDAIRIGVYQNPDLTLEARLSESGRLRYPLLGEVALGGLTLREAEGLIERGLRDGRFVRQPQVVLTLMQVRGHQASVLGHVSRPGRYPIETPGLRLSDLLAQAGGVVPTGADRIVVVGHRDGQAMRLEIDLPRLYEAGPVTPEPEVLAGDVVYVERAPLVYVFGEVQRPGAMRLERDMTLLQALAAGGGLTPRGTERGLQVHRRGADGRWQALRPAMDAALQPGDVVRVPESLF